MMNRGPGDVINNLLKSLIWFLFRWSSRSDKSSTSQTAALCVDALCIPDASPFVRLSRDADEFPLHISIGSR